MKIFCKFPTLNISRLIFLLVICIAKNFVWTTLKAIFSIFWYFCTLRFQIFKYLYLSQILFYPNKPYINGKLSAFRWCINHSFKKLTLMTGFVVQGHICCCFTTRLKNFWSHHGIASISWNAYFTCAASQTVGGACFGRVRGDPIILRILTHGVIRPAPSFTLLRVCMLMSRRIRDATEGGKKRCFINSPFESSRGI